MLLSTRSRYNIVGGQKNGRPAILHPRVIFSKATRRAIFLLLGAALVSIVDSAPAQETVYIGGSGQSSVEINLSVLEKSAAQRSPRTVLQHPGIVQGGLNPVILRPPPETPTAVAPRNKPAKILTKTEVGFSSDPPAVKLKSPKPESMPESAPVAAAEQPIEEMTTEEYAGARKSDSNQVSSTSFAEETNFAGTSQSEPAAIPKAAKTKIATLDPTGAPKTPGDAMQIIFPAGESALPQDAQASLVAVAARLGQDETLRLQLKAYAGAGADTASHARRLSLSRALSVRSKLIERGVRSTRIDVRALGNKSESRPIDRVDVILVKR